MKRRQSWFASAGESRRVVHPRCSQEIRRAAPPRRDARAADATGGSGRIRTSADLVLWSARGSAGRRRDSDRLAAPMADRAAGSVSNSRRRQTVRVESEPTRVRSPARTARNGPEIRGGRAGTEISTCRTIRHRACGCHDETADACARQGRHAIAGEASPDGSPEAEGRFNVCYQSPA